MELMLIETQFAVKNIVEAHFPLNCDFFESFSSPWNRLKLEEIELLEGFEH